MPEALNGSEGMQEARDPFEKAWYDGDYEPNSEEAQRFIMWEEENANELLGFIWGSEPQTWGEKKWVKVESVMDSGAAAPVAPA